jgi:molybdopterin converting factor small subunit
MALVHVPTTLRYLTGGADTVRAAGATVADVFADVERQHPGLMAHVIDGDAIRPEIIVAVGQDEAKELLVAVGENDEVFIVPSIAGGASA